MVDLIPCLSERIDCLFGYGGLVCFFAAFERATLKYTVIFWFFENKYFVTKQQDKLFYKIHYRSRVHLCTPKTAFLS